MSRYTLTKAQERDLVAILQGAGATVRPLTLRKLRLAGLADDKGRLTDDGVILARALEHEHKAAEGELA